VLGTADYMSPEQAEGKVSTSRCDLYSLGSVLYALLVGRPPFAGKSLPEVIQGLRFEKPIPIRRINPDIPEEFESIIMQLLEKEPQKRIPTAVAVAKRLKAMEHALSMETRAGHELEPDLDSLDDDDEELRLSPEQGISSPASPSTSFSTAIRPTMPMHTPQKTDVAPSPASVHTIVAGKGASGGNGAIAAAQEEMELAPPPPRKTHFTTVSEAELRRADRSRDDEPAVSSWIWLTALLVTVALLLGGVVWYANQRPSADGLYTRIKAAADNDDPLALSGVESDAKKFLAYYGADARADEVKQFQEEIELDRLQKQFARRARRSPTGDVSPIERLYMEAVLLTTSDPNQALAKFQALVDVYGTSQDANKSLTRNRNRQCIELAQKQIDRLQIITEKLNLEQRQLIQEQLDRAAALQKKDPAAAAKIYRGVVELYHDKPWFSDLVQAAKKESGVGSQESGSK